MKPSTTIQEPSVGLKFKSIHFKADAEILSIDKEKNSLRVLLGESDTLQWEEDWNLQHTIWGFEHKEYFTTQPCPPINEAGEVPLLVRWVNDGYPPIDLNDRVPSVVKLVNEYKSLQEANTKLEQENKELKKEIKRLQS